MRFFPLRIHLKTFTTGDLVRASGIYSVTHAAHRLLPEAALFRGEVFPKCARCCEAVTFQAIREFPGFDLGENITLRIPLYELPVLENETEISSVA